MDFFIFEKKGNKIYIKHSRKPMSYYVFSLILPIIFLIVFISIIVLLVLIYRGPIYIDVRVGHRFEAPPYFREYWAIGGIIIFGINLIKMLIELGETIYDGNCDYHINLKTKRIHFIDGISIYKKEIVIDFSQIKDIVIVKESYKPDYGVEEQMNIKYIFMIMN